MKPLRSPNYLYNFMRLFQWEADQINFQIGLLHFFNFFLSIYEFYNEHVLKNKT